MDKIYSRRRITFFNSNNKNIKVKLKIVLVLIIAVLTACVAVKSIDPIFDKLCEEKAIEIASEVASVKTTEVLTRYEYTDIVTITKNESEGSNILKTDVAVINDIASDISTEISKGLKEKEDENIEIPLGAISGNKYLSGFGPKMKMSIISRGNVITDLKTEFVAQGINQTSYRIYLEIVCNVNIINSYKIIEKEIVSQVLLVETVIVGDVPETYYNLEGIREDDYLDTIN